MQLHTVEAKTRSTGRKGLNTQARVEGNIPSVLYGNNAQNMTITVNRRSLEKILHTEGGTHALLQLEFEEAPEANTPVIVKAIQNHPVSGAVLHVDFLRISLDERIQSPVSIVLNGRPKGVIDGGIMDHQIREVTVECLALDIPEHLAIDITNLGMGESLHVSDLQAPEGVTILSDPALTIASIHAPRVVKAEEAPVAEEAEEAKEESKTEE